MHCFRVPGLKDVETLANLSVSSHIGEELGSKCDKEVKVYEDSLLSNHGPKNL